MTPRDVQQQVNQIIFKTDKYHSCSVYHCQHLSTMQFGCKITAIMFINKMSVVIYITWNLLFYLLAAISQIQQTYSDSISESNSVNTFPILKNILFLSICLCAYFAWTVNAEEKLVEDDLNNDQTTQPLLIDSDPEPGNEAKTTENQTDEEIITNDALIENSINETTPEQDDFRLIIGLGYDL